MERIPLARPYWDEECEVAALFALRSGRWVKGPQAKALGEEFANWCGAQAAVPCQSGSAALWAAMRLLGIGPGDEVIVPGLTFIATATAVSLVGATPIFADIEEEYWCICPKDAESKITNRTKAIIGVHIFGQPFSSQLREVCDRHDIALIEDAAQAHGAELNNKRIGSIGDLATFSFFPSKNLTVGGDGGAILANTTTHSNSISAAVNHGLDNTGKYNFLSSNYRLSEIQCAIGRIQLKHLENWCNRRREIAERYSAAFDKSATPSVRDDCKHAWNQYVLKTERATELVSHLQSHNIASTIHYPIPCHLQPLYSTHHQHKAGIIPVTEEICKQLVSIPIFPQLTEEEVDHIIAAVTTFHF